ncbi:MAG: polysaccharide deacetylase family protein [Lachnospiraceae bacterium]|nr:polysaccharide deacetylase family protein [Lachnospiraceae bacterium]
MKYAILILCIIDMVLLGAVFRVGQSRADQSNDPALPEHRYGAPSVPVMVLGTGDGQDGNSTGKEEKNVQDVVKIAITFDDGPHPVYTEKLLDGLKKRGVHATFFVTGKSAEAYPELVKREQEEGHVIGNHTYSHLQLTKGNRRQFKEELQKTNQIIKGITGCDTSFVRPPYGAWDKSLETELNMIPVLWNVDPLDWCSDDADCITRNIIAKVKENSIILMHDQYPSTLEAAFRVIDELQKKGYTFVTVEEILFD